MFKRKLGAALAAFALVTAATATEARELRLGTSAPEKSPWGQFYLMFGKDLAERSGGKLTINPFFSAALGDEQQMVRQAARGRIDMVGVSTTAASLMVPEFALIGAPYLFDDLKQADCVADEHLVKQFAPMFIEKGLRPMTWTEVGYQVLFGMNPIKVPDDVKGTKVRAAPTKTDMSFLTSVGATAVPLGVQDIMPALKTGGVSAASLPIVYGVAVGYHKVATQISATRHVHQLGVNFISEKVWKSLSAQEQAWLNESSAKVFPGLRQAIRQAEVGLLKKAVAEGATLYEPTADELKLWAASAPATYQEVIKETGGKTQQIYLEIVRAKAACTNK
ncbi:MAG: TRAP transporter substrate-binding protein DctP [Burkholderiaceae bacterium]